MWRGRGSNAAKLYRQPTIVMSSLKSWHGMTGRPLLIGQRHLNIAYMIWASRHISQQRAYTIYIYVYTYIYISIYIIYLSLMTLRSPILAHWLCVFIRQWQWARCLCDVCETQLCGEGALCAPSAAYTVAATHTRPLDAHTHQCTLQTRAIALGGQVYNAVQTACTWVNAVLGVLGSMQCYV